MSEQEQAVVTEAAAVEVPTGDAPDSNTVKVTFTKEQQAEIDRILSERLTRAENKAKEKTDKAVKAAADKALADNAEWQKLAESRGKEIEALAPLQAQLEEANATLKTLLDAEMNNPAMPASTKELLADMTPTKALAHITKHKGEWTKTPVPNLNGAGGGKDVTRTDAEKAELAALYGLDPRFIS